MFFSFSFSFFFFLFLFLFFFSFFFFFFFFLLSTGVRLPPEERCCVMGSREGGSNSIPETVWHLIII